MATPYPYNVIRAPGSLVWNPTDLGAAYPYGGTELGVCRAMEFRPGIKTEKLVAEEWRLPVATIVTQQSAVMFGILRSWDDDFIKLLFPAYATGSKSGRPVVLPNASTGKRTAGFDMNANAGKLLFAPLAPDMVPTILLYRAVPLVDDAAALALRVTEEYGLAFAFETEADATGRTHAKGVLEDLVL